MKKGRLEWSGKMSQRMEEFLAVRGRKACDASPCICPSFLLPSVSEFL